MEPAIECCLCEVVVLPAALTKAEYMASIPKQRCQAPPPPINTSNTVIKGASAQREMEGIAAGNDAGPDTPRIPVPALRDTTAPSKRKVSVEQCATDVVLPATQAYTGSFLFCAYL